MLDSIKITLNLLFWHEMARVLPYTSDVFMNVITKHPNH